MRYVLRFVFVLALGLVGCSEAAPCQSDGDCEDQNECTGGFCDTTTGSCFLAPFREGEICDAWECSYGRCEDGACIRGTGPDYWEDYEGKTCRSQCTNYRCREGECVCHVVCICGVY
jgi:hypothetical protein